LPLGRHYNLSSDRNSLSLRLIT